MKCAICGSNERWKRGTRYSISINEILVVVDNVPAMVCGRCGEVSLAPEVVEHLQQSIWSSSFPRKQIQTETYEYV